MIKKILFMIPLLAMGIAVHAQLQRNEIVIPDVDGFKALKCDFHMHTVFSDGYVWPTTRVNEAWIEGLDAIAITDHLEYLPHKEMVKTNHNNAFEIAQTEAKKRGICLIQGTEITKSMPPGHFNALFINDAAPILQDDYMKAFEEAKKQNAWIIWNHPGWKAQQPDGAKWMKEHEELYQKGYINGIEVFNLNEYYPTVLDWAIEKEITPLACSDVHETMGILMAYLNEEYRPMTLVFAKENTPDSIREALEERRTVAYFSQEISGDEKWVSKLFHSCITLQDSHYNDEKKSYHKILNNSSIDIVLQKVDKQANGPDKIVINAGKTELVAFNLGTEKAAYEVVNFHISSGSNLIVNF
jgi:hypothetical protein